MHSKNLLKSLPFLFLVLLAAPILSSLPLYIDKVFFVPPTPLNDSTIEGNSIPFNVSVNYTYLNNVFFLAVDLYDSADNFINGFVFYGSHGEGSFDSISDGTYYLHASALLSNGSVINSELRYVSINNSLFINFVDPTPINNSLITMSNPLIIKVKSNKNLTDILSVFVFNESGEIISALNSTNSSEFYQVYNLSDGNYSFSANASIGPLTVSTPIRYIQVYATPPEISNLSFAPSIPNFALPGELNLSLEVNFSLSVFPVVAFMKAELSNGTEIPLEGLYFINESFVFPAKFNLSNLNSEGSYGIYLYVRDKYGNFRKALLGSVSVSLPSTTPVSTGGGGGGGGGGTGGWSIVVIANKTNETSNQVEEPKESTNLSELATNKTSQESPKKGFVSTITGAVTGVLSDPSKITLVIVALVVIIYIISKIRKSSKNKSSQTEKKQKKTSNNDSSKEEEKD